MRLVGRPSEAEIAIVVGDGSSDFPRIERALERHNDNYCDVSVYLPTRSKDGKGQVQGPAIGVVGVFRHIKSATIRHPPRNFVIFIDREHLWEAENRGLGVEGYVSEKAKEHGINVMSVTRLSDSTYRVCGKVGSKGFLAYFIFVGNCCIEDLTLRACGKEVEEIKGPGCCKRYKEALRKLPWDERKRCEYIAEGVLFQEFSKALDDFRKSPCIN